MRVDQWGRESVFYPEIKILPEWRRVKKCRKSISNPSTNSWPSCRRKSWLLWNGCVNWSFTVCRRPGRNYPLMCPTTIITAISVLSGRPLLPGEKTKLIIYNGTKNFFREFVKEVKTAARGTGDNAYVYLPLSKGDYTIRGTIPAGESGFTISGAVYNGAEYMVADFGAMIARRIKSNNSTSPVFIYRKTPDTARMLYTHYSPALDSIIYWFNKKSINLYGEALVKTFALEKQGYASTDSGVAILRRFWKDKGLDPEELNMYDGSGLSPLNRVTTHAQVEILKFAKTRSWFSAFYDALPEYNGMKMKSGTISDVKGYCGYHKAKDGREYIFSFLINNYSGKTGPVVSKMFKVLDELK